MFGFSFLKRTLIPIWWVLLFNSFNCFASDHVCLEGSDSSWSTGFRDNDYVKMICADGSVLGEWGIMCSSEHENIFSSMRASSSNKAFEYKVEKDEETGKNYISFLLTNFPKETVMAFWKHLRLGTRLNSSEKKDPLLCQLIDYTLCRECFDSLEPECKVFDPFTFQVKSRFSEKIHNKEEVDFTFIYLPGGEFFFGSPIDEIGRCYSESEQQKEIVRPFWLMKYPLTREQWLGLMEKMPLEKDSDNKSLKDPAGFINMNEDIPALLKNLNSSVGDKLRLEFFVPNEKQWEYAARGGTETRNWWVDSNNEIEISSHAYWSLNRCETREVGLDVSPISHENPFGFVDITGNVWEWTTDIFKGSCFVIRGGGQCRQDLRSATRCARGSKVRESNVGVRLAARSF